MSTAHVLRPRKFERPPHVPPAVSCWCEAQRARLGAFRAGAGEQCRARGPWGCIWERLAQARAKRSSGFRAGRGGLRATLGKRDLPWSIRALNSVEPGPKKTGTVRFGRHALRRHESLRVRVVESPVSNSGPEFGANPRCQTFLREFCTKRAEFQKKTSGKTRIFFPRPEFH